MHSRFSNPKEILQLDLNQLENEISDHLCKHLFEFVAKYKPDSDSEIVKIRRQGTKEQKGFNGAYFTDRATFKFGSSFFIEASDQDPNIYFLHIVDHDQTLEGAVGRVLAVTSILKLNLHAQTHKKIQLDKDDSNNEIPPLLRIKAPKKNTDYKSENLTLSREHIEMSRFNPSNPALKEFPYHYHKVSDSDKHRLFMPNKGTTLSRMFLNKGWATKRTVHLLQLGTKTMSGAEQLCRAVATLHNSAIIHRDLKPQNIFVKNNESGLYVTLGDFGASCSVGNKCSFYGTAKYTPQEELFLLIKKKQEGISEKAYHQPSTDIYALCLVLAQWLFLKSFSTILEDNFKHWSAEKTQDQIKHDGNRIVADVVDYDPRFKPLLDLIKKGFSLKQEERPSAEELADCIQFLTKDYYQQSAATANIKEEDDRLTP